MLRHLPDLIACCTRVQVPEDGMLYTEGEQADDMLLVLSAGQIHPSTHTTSKGAFNSSL